MDLQSPKDDNDSDHFFLPSLEDQPKAKTKIPIIVQGSMPESENLITVQKLQAFLHHQNQLKQSQEALANHYLNMTRVIKQIQSQQNLSTLEADPSFGFDQKKKMSRVASTNSLKQQASIQDIKGNVKNAYIKKITSLLNLKQEGQAQQESNQQILRDEESSSELSQDFNQRKLFKTLKSKGILGSTQDLLSIEEKNVKMKESAKNSRLRKKVYISMLEKKVEEFQDKIIKYQQGTAASQKFIDQTLAKCDPIHSLVVGQVSLQTQLKQCLQKENNAEELQLLQDSYQMRFGSAGIKRKAYIKYCFSNMGRLLLQSNYGMLIFGCGDRQKTSRLYQQIFIGSDEFNDYIRDFKQCTGVDDETQIYKVLSIINSVIDHKSRFERLVKQLTKSFNRLRQHQSQLDDSVSSMLQEMNQTQQGILIEETSKHKTNPPNFQMARPQFFDDEDDYFDLGGKKKICY